MFARRAKAFFLFSFIVITLSLFFSSVYAQIPTTETAGAVEKQRQDAERDKRLEERITQPKISPITEEKKDETKPLPAGEKVLINKVIVEEATLITADDIKKVTSKYEGKELTLSEMQKVVDAVTDIYRSKGFATSRAYLPVQTIGKDGVLTIRVVEGKVGEVTIKGNKWFKTALLKKKLKLKTDDNFDYARLQKSLTHINEHPDRNAKAVLVPGKTPGTTDVVVEVKDRLPIHVGYEHDNYASRYVGQNRNSVFFEDNNLLGLDDKLYFKYQLSRSSLYTMRNVRYTLPVMEDFDLGGYWLYSRMRLGRDFEAIDSRGHSTLAGIFANKGLYNTQDIDVRLNLGFDYKDIDNYLGGEIISTDYMRVIKTGLDIDITDKWGRTLILPEIDTGIPRMWGGLTAKDPMSSRGASGSGGKFTKGTLSAYRLQPTPFDSTLLFKYNGQFSNYSLVAAEQYQIGGPTSVRGYPVGERSGDEGMYLSGELSFPYYFIPRKATIPFTKEKLYDDLRLVVFYDWATTHTKNPSVGENKHYTLRGWGFGTRFNILERLSLKVEWGYPIGKTPSDTRHVHPWVEFSWKF